MTFLEPAMLWALPLVALPIVIHLLNRRRHRRVEWGAMQFLLTATRQRKGHSRLRHLLILLLRMIAVAAVVFVIGRPMSGRWLGWLTGRTDTILVLLDRSASMSQRDSHTGQSKQTLALTQLSDAIRQTGMPKQLVLVESCAVKPVILESAAALTDLPEVGPTDGTSHLPAMFQAALEYLMANQAGRTDIWVCSDLKANDWNSDPGRWEGIRQGFADLKSAVRFHVWVDNRVDPDNLSVRVTKLVRQRQGDNDRLVMNVLVKRQRTDPPRRLPLEIVVDGARSATEIELTGTSAELIEHGVVIDAQRAQGWGKVELPDDTNPRDNVYYFHYGQVADRRALVVSDEPGAAWSLRLAASPQLDDVDTATPVISVEDFGHAELEPLSLLIWQAPLPSGEHAARVERFVQQGGQVLLLPAQTDDVGSFRGQRWGAWITAAGDSVHQVDQWRNDSGWLQHSDDGVPLPVNQLHITRYRELIGEAASRGLWEMQARFHDHSVLLAFDHSPPGGVTWLTTLPHEPFSDFAQQGIVLYALIQRLLSSGTQQQAVRQFGEIGMAPSRPTGHGEVIDAWTESRFTTEQPFIAGVYSHNEQLLTQNRPLAEDTLDVLSTAQLQQTLAGLNYEIVSQGASAERSLVREIWRAFVFMLLLALLGEGLLCLPDVRPKRGVVA